jgi:hypothetical protein
VSWLRKDPEPDPAPEQGGRLTGKDLEKAQELVREMLKADREAAEKYSMIKRTLP